MQALLIITYGYQLKPSITDRKKQVLKPNPLETGTVNRIFELKLSGYGGKQIA